MNIISDRANSLTASRLVGYKVLYLTTNTYQVKSRLSYIIAIALFALSVWGVCYLIKWQPATIDATKVKAEIESSIVKIATSSSKQLATLKTTIYKPNSKLDKTAYNNLLNSNNNDAYFFITHNDSLVYWSSNRLHPDSIDLTHNESFFTTSAISGIHISTPIQGGRLHMLTPLIHQYPIHNQHLRNRISSQLNAPKNISLTPFKNNTNNTHPILWNKTPVLQMLISASSYPSQNAVFIVLLYLFAIGLLLVTANNFAARLNKKTHILMATAIYVMINGVLFFLFNSFSASSQLSYTELFSPTIFASSHTFASLGHFTLFSFQMLALSLYFFRLNIAFDNKSYIPHIIQTLLVAFLLFEISLNTINLINNSTFSLLIFKLVSLPYYALLAFTAILVQFAAFYLTMHKSYVFLRLDTNKKTVVAIRLIGTLLCYLIFYFQRNIPVSVALFLILFISLYDSQVHFEKPSSGLKPLQWVLITFFSLFLSHIILSTSATKQQEEDELIAANLSNNMLNEHDFETEDRLPSIEETLISDQSLQKMISDPGFPLDRIENYLLANQFAELKDKYDIQFIICWPDAILDLEKSDSITNCYNYFQEIFLEKGLRLDQSNFYFIDNKNGRISYFGQITVNSKKYDEITLFIDIESTVTSAGSGYPEILKSNQNKTFDIPQNYSSARYIDGKLVTSTGTFNYSPLGTWLKHNKTANIHQCKFDNYVHTTVNSSNNIKVIVSRPEETAFAFILLFSYVFLLTYLFIQIVFSSQKLFSRNTKTNTIERKLKVSFAVLLIFSFLLLSSLSLYFTYDQQTSHQEATLIEKLEIIHTGLEQYGGNSATLQDISDEFMLDMYLNDLSNMFKCDINIYATSGELFATSRPEIFNLNLTSTLINPEALFPLLSGQQKIAIQNELLGTLSYSSLYMLLTNDMNTPIGIVNVPFFVSSQNLTRALSNYLVISFNLFIVFLVLTIIFSTTLGKRLVQPIKTIQQKIGQIRLGQKNEIIAYKGEDELKELVVQYNKLVSELEKSAQLLAQSERESAWRKMARQIAHEIKNPLTPMRLSIQQLQRLSKDDPKHFESIFAKTSTSLIEQIDSLSDIASSFSDFAKTPQSNIDPMEINERLEMILGAFQNMSNIVIELIKYDTPLYILADKNQFTQLINNLLKNAIQAIPKGEKGLIKIKVSYQTDKAIIEINDNGKGIPAEIKEKLFEPNFTTKTSGMGLGLAISKNIVSGMHGRIYFTSIPHNNTTFTIELPTI